MIHGKIEIGSEFWDVPATEKETGAFPEAAQWFLCGRSALQAIFRELGNARSVSLPSWCCDSMVKPFADAGIAVHFYPVYWQNGLIQEPSLDRDILFLMDYFGYTAPAPDLSAYRGVVIRDVTHSLFSKFCADADYFFGSLRKWCGVWSGGYAWTADGHPLSMENASDGGFVRLRKQAMRLKSAYIHGRADADGNVPDKRYLEVFEEAERCLEQVGIAQAAERDVALARRLDRNFIRSRRRENAGVLMRELKDDLIFPELGENDCPLFVPVLVPDGKRDALRKHLIRNEIYCPVHWPVSEYHVLDTRTESLYRNELSLVCDQRYTADDMRRIVDAVKQFMEE